MVDVKSLQPIRRHRQVFFAAVCFTPVVAIAELVPVWLF